MKMKNPREMEIVFPNFWCILGDLMIIEESLGSIGYVMSIYPIVKVAIDNKGYTDNYMDYDWKKVNAPDSSDNDFKGKMYSFFKWQWEIMRRDRSLIFNY